MKIVYSGTPIARPEKAVKDAGSMQTGCPSVMVTGRRFPEPLYRCWETERIAPLTP